MRHAAMTLLFLMLFVSSALAFVGNMRTHKFHVDDCRTVKRMNEANKVQFQTRKQAVKSGYVPCKVCRP